MHPKTFFFTLLLFFKQFPLPGSVSTVVKLHNALKALISKSLSLSVPMKTNLNTSVKLQKRKYVPTRTLLIAALKMMMSLYRGVS